MTEPIVSLSLISTQAATAAKLCRDTGLQQANEYPVGSAAYQEFHRLYVLELLRLSGAECGVAA
jgi:hypothetical protein